MPGRIPRQRVQQIFSVILFALLISASLKAAVGLPVFPSESSPKVVVVHRTGPNDVQVTRDGAKVPPEELHVEVLPKENREPAVPSLTDKERQELDKWRKLSRFPICLTLVNGVLTIEWAGVRKSAAFAPQQQIQLQLAPK